jgi:integrase/recombinase XerD
MMPAVVVTSGGRGDPAPMQLIERRGQEDEEKQRVWATAFELWSQGGWRSQGKRVSTETRRAYLTSVTAFFEFAAGVKPWRILESHVVAWQKSLEAEGIANTTINLRLSALSSLYHFLLRFSYPDPISGETKYIILRNPVTCDRARVDPYENSDGLSIDEARALLMRGCDCNTLEGLRNFSLFHTFLYTGCRVSEVLRLRWGDLVEDKGKMFYRWSGKAGKSGTYELPRNSYEAICAYLKAAGRLDTIGAEDYLFTALSNEATARLDAWRAAENGTPMPDRSKPRPITAVRVGAILKSCARRAGLDPVRIHPHILRHTAADLMDEASGGNLLDVQEFLHHSTLALTQIYLTRRKKNTNPHWMKVEQLLGI